MCVNTDETVTTGRPSYRGFRLLMIDVFIDFLGALAELREATINFVMSVCLSVRMEELGSHCADLHDI